MQRDSHNPSNDRRYCDGGRDARFAAAETRRISVCGGAGSASVDVLRTSAVIDAADKTSLLQGRAGHAVPPSRLGPFELRCPLGRGGMGTVYEAVQDDPRRTVALKVIRGGDWADERDVQLFRREAQSLSRLDHPNVGAIYESGSTDDGWHYIAMELVRGRALTEHVGQPGFTLRDKLVLFRSICLAVEHAHRRGVIHRDLKPSNVMVTRAGQPKILDFGLARLTSPGAAQVTELSQAGQIRGTFAYMSPEQAGGEPGRVDSRSDVYALGIMLYELLTGRRPYELTGRSVAAAIRTINEGEPPRPSDVDPTLRGDLEAIILQAMHKSAACRYASARALADDVSRFLQRRPIMAPPRAQRAAIPWLQRHRATARTLALMLPLLVWFALALHHQQGESDRLRAERDAALEAKIAAEARAQDAWLRLGGTAPAAIAGREVVPAARAGTNSTAPPTPTPTPAY